jgi:ketosteroid isomerase-like protein
MSKPPAHVSQHASAPDARRRGLLRAVAVAAAIGLVAIAGCARAASPEPVPVAPSAASATTSRTSALEGTASPATDPVDSTSAGEGVGPTPTAPARAGDAAQEIRAMLDDRWTAGVNRHDLDLKLSAYADTVSPFFGRTTATKAAVRKVFAVAFDRYRTMTQRLERVDIKVTGDRAVVVVYKTRVYDGDPGWSEERLGLARTAQGWRIVSERDIRSSD